MSTINAIDFPSIQAYKEAVYFQKKGLLRKNWVVFYFLMAHN